MLYSITVDLGDPQGDNDALLEALDIIGEATREAEEAEAVAGEHAIPAYRRSASSKPQRAG
jgi:hypothetical protein